MMSFPALIALLFREKAGLHFYLICPGKLDFLHPAPLLQGRNHLINDEHSLYCRGL